MMWLQSARAAGPSYANATSGALYRGVARATVRPSFSTPTSTPTPQRENATPVVRSTALPLSMGAGIFLFIAGGAISGYDWLRARRIPVPAADQEDDELDDDLLDADLLDDAQGR